MNKLFRILSIIITVLSILLMILPFSFVIKEGLSFVFDLPYSKEINFAFGLSMKSSIVSSILCMVCTLSIVHVMNTSNKLKNTIEYIFSLPLGVPHLVSGIALITFFGRNNFGGFLSKFGIDFVYTTSGVMLAQFFVNLPYCVKTYSTAYDLIDKKLLFCARSLGLSEWKVFLNVNLPMMKKQIFSIWMICWARALGEFGAVMMLVGVTRMKTETLATSIFLNMSTGDFDVAAGVSVILIGVSMITMYIFQKLVEKGDLNA